MLLSIKLLLWIIGLDSHVGVVAGCNDLGINYFHHLLRFSQLSRSYGLLISEITGVAFDLLK